MRHLLALFAALTLTAAALAQAGFGPLDPSKPTDISTDEIVRQMGERELEFSKARDQYTFRQTVTVQTISDDTNRPDGTYHDVEDIVLGDDGKRTEHVVFAPQNTIERVIMTESDFDDIKHRLPFILTTPELPQYNITYLGRQHVDELDTYVFDVAPKELVKGKRYFQGKAWVDVTDKQIVLVNGLNVPQDTRRGHEDLSPPFTTYYQQVDGKYWFPTYTKAEGILHFAAQNGALSQDVHMRATVKYTDYKRFHATATIRTGDAQVQPDQPQNKPDTPPQSPPKP
jgi:hypothetical protein